MISKKKPITIFSLGVSLWLASTWHASAMSFETQERCLEGLNPRCQPMILAVGPITKETPAQFKSFAKDWPRGSWVAISSPGGHLVGGMQLGLAIREAGFNTTIGSTDFSPPDCLSACAYAFLGGVSRKLTPGSRYGLHQFRGVDQEISAADSQKISAMLAKYLDAMGVDRKLLDYAQLTASHQVTFLSSAQATLLRVDTGNQSSYPRWRVDVTPTSTILAISSGLFTQPLGVPITLGLMPAPEKSKTFIFLVYYKVQSPGPFNQPGSHYLRIHNETFSLLPLGGWQEKSGGYQISFLLSEKIVSLLMQLSENTILSLQSTFEEPLVMPANPLPVATVMTYFGAVNLKNSLQGLAKRP